MPEDCVPYDETDPFDDIERRLNIHKLQNEAREIAAGDMLHFESEDLPTEIAEQFWGNVVAFERAPDTTLLEKMTQAGMEVPAPDELDDLELNLKLGQIIDFLAARQTFLHSTDHLSDRELYLYLRDEALREPVKDLPSHPDWRLHLDVLGSGSEEDTYLNFRFYADQRWRQSWMEQFPDYQMPPRETPPFDRDRFLPQAEYPHLQPEDDDFDEDDFEEDETGA